MPIYFEKGEPQPEQLFDGCNAQVWVQGESSVWDGWHTVRWDAKRKRWLLPVYQQVFVGNGAPPREALEGKGVANG